MWVSGWSVAKKRPECPFVCHALIINQNTIMFGILNDLIHPNDMFTVYWELLRQQLSQASLHDTTSAAGVVCWAEMHHTKWPTCTTARSVGRASCKWWTRNKSFTRTSNLRSANSEGFHERKKKAQTCTLREVTRIPNVFLLMFHFIISRQSKRE